MSVVEPFPPYETSEAPAPAPQPGPPAVALKRPGLAALFALFPGVGHIYDGLYLRGLVFFLIIASLIGLVARGHGLLGIAISFFWLFNVLDAYRQAALINYGYAQDLGLLDRPQSPVAGQVGLVAGILLTSIGLFALADRYLAINLDWLLDLWPVVLVVAGVWLIVGALRDRKRGQSSSL